MAIKTRTICVKKTKHIQEDMASKDADINRIAIYKRMSNIHKSLKLQGERLCYNCGATVNEGNDFCPQCGARLNKICEKCKSTNEIEDDYCKNCGNKLA